MKKILLMLALVAGVSFGQTLPGHLSGGGLGFRQAEPDQKFSGWSNFCVPVAGTKITYACAATDFSGGTTSARADLDILVYNFRDTVYFFGKGGAGASSNSSNLGGSFDGGAGLVADPSKIPFLKKFAKTSDYLLAFSGSWQKNNVNELFGPGFNLKSFGSQTIWRFGILRSW